MTILGVKKVMKEMKRLCFAALLLFSAVCLRAQSPADCEKVITIPISLSEDNLIVTQATINGEKHNFIINSGCSALYLNSKYFGNGTRVSTTNKDVNGAISTSQSYVQVDSFDFNFVVPERETDIHKVTLQGAVSTPLNIPCATSTEITGPSRTY